MVGTCRLNNKSMRIGSGIPEGLILPNGKNNMVSEEDLTDDEGKTEPDN